MLDSSEMWRSSWQGLQDVGHQRQRITACASHPTRMEQAARARGLVTSHACTAIWHSFSGLGDHNAI